MKKILLTMAVAVLTVAASAQSKFYVGGSLEYSSSSFDGKILNDKFTLLPEVGYSLNDKMAIGVELGYSSESKKSSNPVNTAGTLTFNPYFRYTFFQLGKVAVFGDGMFSLALENNESRYDGGTTNTSKYTTIGVFVKPGISYSLNDRFSLVAKFGDALGFSSRRSGDSGAKATTSFSLLKLSNQLAFGFYYNF